MDAFISVFDKDSEEYEKLQIAALMLTNRSAKHYKYYVGQTYFDFGQNWEWTTILSNGGNWGGFQALYPSEQEKIILASTYCELVAIVEKILKEHQTDDNLRIKG